MPPKTKLHKSTGKPKSMPIPQNIPNRDLPGLTPEQAQQFELELCWCIQQLQTALKSGKLNEKQVNDHTKALNTLMNNSAPIIKKRQVMRLSFGDYRAKMAAEDKKLKPQTSKIKVSKVEPSKKSAFIKKSVFQSSSNNSFRFNFIEPDNKDVADEILNLNLENVNQGGDIIESFENKNATINCLFKKSDNSFRFNFDVGSEQ